MNRERTLVVLPCYNEGDNIRPLVEEITGLGLALDVLIVDDNSPDGTGRIAEELRATCPQISVLHRPGKLGLGTAYRAGFRWALERDYGRVVTMDADCSHQPRYLPRLVETGRRADLVIGSRYTEGGGAEGWPLRRKIISGTANRLARVLLGVTARDCTSGYRCYSSAALIRIDPETVLSSGYSFLVEMLYRVERTGLTVAETPIIFIDRAAGRSKISRIEVYKTLFTLARLRLPGLPWAWLGRAGQHISERGALVAALAALGGVWALGRLRR